jgi:hypothetical protein
LLNLFTPTRPGPRTDPDEHSGETAKTAAAVKRAALVAVLLWFAASFCYQRLPSADLWWLLADGRLIWDSGSIPTYDPFSWTAAEAAWHNDQWLPALLFYGVHESLGLSGLHALKSSLLLLTLAIALHTGRQLGGSGGALLLAAALALLCSEARFFFDVRAYLFTYLLLVVLWRWLQLCQRPRWLAIAALFTVWGNLHGGVSSGLLLLGLAAAFSERERRLHLLKLLGVAALCSCLNPSGPALLLHPIKLLGSPWGRFLNEWQPVWRRPKLFSIHLLHLAGWVVLWWRGGMQREDRILAAFGLFSLTGWRHIPLFALLSIPRWAARVRIPWGERGEWALAALLLAGAGLTPLRVADPRQSMEHSHFPIWAGRFLAANRLPARLFQPYGVGGYVLWKNGPTYQVCIDGRAVQVYPWAAYEEYLRAAMGDPADFEAFCRQHDVRLAMLFADGRREASSRLVGPGWNEIYRDDLVALYLRGELDRPLVQVETPYGLWQQALREPAAAEKLLTRALQLDPDYPPARFALAEIELARGRPEPMLGVVAEYPRVAEGHRALAEFFRDRDPARARYHAERAR